MRGVPASRAEHGWHNTGRQIDRTRRAAAFTAWPLVVNAHVQRCRAIYVAVRVQWQRANWPGYRGLRVLVVRHGQRTQPAVLISALCEFHVVFIG